MVTIVTVDDTNTVQLKYDDKWFHGNWTDTSTQPPSNRSLASSNDVTAQVVLVFPVAGTGISYYGMRRSGGGSFRICIDCDPNQPAGPFDTIDALNATDDGKNPPDLLYSKQGLKNDFHTIVLMNTNDTRVHPQGGSQITLDRFEITAQDPPAVTVTNTVESTATRSFVPSSSSSRGASVNPGLIAGAVIGALALLALLVGLFLCWSRKRRTTSGMNIEEGPKSKEMHTPKPFTITRWQNGRRPDPTLRSTPFSNILITTNVKGSLASSPAQDSRPSQPTSPTRPSQTSLESTSSSQIVLPTTSSRTNHRRMERDAGPVHEDEVDDDEGTLPPDYSQVYNPPSSLEPPPGLPSNMSSARNDGHRRDGKRT